MINLSHKVDTNHSSKIHKIQSMHMFQIQVTSIQLKDNISTPPKHITIYTSKVSLFLKWILITMRKLLRAYSNSWKGEKHVLFIARMKGRENPWVGVDRARALSESKLTRSDYYGGGATSHEVGDLTPHTHQLSNKMLPTQQMCFLLERDRIFYTS